MKRTKQDKYDLISISHYFPPRIGGLENMAYKLLDGLSKKDIRCLSLFGSDHTYTKSQKNFHQESFKVTSIFNKTYPLFGLQFFRRIIQLLRENPNSKVLIHSRHLTSSILAALACEMLGHPYTVIEHNGGRVYFSSQFVSNIANWVDKNIFSLVLENSEDILAVSKSGREWISQNFNISKRRIGVIYNSFDTKFDTRYLKKKENIVVFASKWIPVKDPTTTLKAFLHIANKFPGWEFVIIGEGKELKMPDGPYPKNIEIINRFMPQSELFEFLKRTKIYINSSKSEGLALAILEAVSFGNIPVVSNAPSNVEIANTLNTKEYVFRRGIYKDLAKALEKAIYKSKDLVNLKKIVSKNSEVFTREKMIQNYYTRLLPNHYERKNMKAISIVIPVYNEERTISQLLDRVLDVEFPNGLKKEIIIVNDHSTDKSRDIIANYIKHNKRKASFKLIDNKRNKGKSQSVKTGVLATTGSLVVTQDADLEYTPNDLRKFVRTFLSNPTIDVIYGNRFNTGNSFNNGVHSLGNRFVTVVSNFFTKPRGFAPKDMETCYKMVRGDIMRNLFRTLESQSNFGLEPELTAKLAKYRKPNGKRLQFEQIDIHYKPRTISQGKKMRWFKHGFEALLEILYFNFQHFTVQEYVNGHKVRRQF